MAANMCISVKKKKKKKYPDLPTFFSRQVTVNTLSFYLALGVARFSSEQNLNIWAGP